MKGSRAHSSCRRHFPRFYCAVCEKSCVQSRCIQLWMISRALSASKARCPCWGAFHLYIQRQRCRLHLNVLFNFSQQFKSACIGCSSTPSNDMITSIIFKAILLFNDISGVTTELKQDNIILKPSYISVMLIGTPAQLHSDARIILLLQHGVISPWNSHSTSSCTLRWKCESCKHSWIISQEIKELPGPTLCSILGYIWFIKLPCAFPFSLIASVPIVTFVLHHFSGLHFCILRYNFYWNCNNFSDQSNIVCTALRFSNYGNHWTRLFCFFAS